MLGPYIQLSMSEAVIRLPDPEFKGYIHTDGGQALQHIRLSDTSWPLQLKIQYFLTDVLEPNGGNFTLVPGSHRQAYPEEGLPDGPESPGTVQLSVKAGDAAIFTHSIWHGPARNLSGQGPQDADLLLQPAVLSPLRLRANHHQSCWRVAHRASGGCWATSARTGVRAPTSTRRRIRSRC